MDIPRLGQTNNNVPVIPQRKQGQSGYTTEHDKEIFALTDEEKMAFELLVAEREFYNAQQQQPPSQDMLQQIAPRMKFGYGGEPTFSANIPYTPLRVSARPVGRNPAVSVRERVDF
jgi:hypothetical protein